MKSKITLILGIIDTLLVTAVIGMLILNGINSQTVEPRFDTKKVIKEANTSKDPKQPHLYTGAIDKPITITPKNDAESDATTKEETVSERPSASSVYSGNVEDDITRIRTQWQTIQDNLNHYQMVDAGSGITHYCEDVNGVPVIRKAVVKTSGASEEYFYEYTDGTYEPFFIFVTGTDLREDRYYFADYQLIRWIEAKQGGTIHDLDTANPEYVQRGETYLDKAFSAIGM